MEVSVNIVDLLIIILFSVILGYLIAKQLLLRKKTDSYEIKVDWGQPDARWKDQ